MDFIIRPSIYRHFVTKSGYNFGYIVKDAQRKWRNPPDRYRPLFSVIGIALSQKFKNISRDPLCGKIHVIKPHFFKKNLKYYEIDQ